MVSTGSSNSWLINRDNSSIGVSNKLGVQVEWSTISIANSSIRSRCNKRSSSHKRSSSSICNSLGSKVVSTGSSNSWLIKRNNSSIGVSDKLSVQVKGTSISVTGSIRSISSISQTSRGNQRSSCSISWSISSIAYASSITSISQTSSKLGGEVVSPGSGNCWLINWGHSAIGVGLETKESLGRGKSNTGSENLKKNLEYQPNNIYIYFYQKLHFCR
jgi:hypothetical protein